jgi:hypothetical protein
VVKAAKGIAIDKALVAEIIKKKKKEKCQRINDLVTDRATFHKYCLAIAQELLCMSYIMFKL